MEEHTDILGIPVLSTDKLFLTFIVVNILVSFVAVISGLIAMFADKGKTAHSTTGKLYYWSML